jgi:hypothetical protein
MAGRRLDWPRSSYGQLVGSCEHGNEHSGFSECEEFIYRRRNCLVCQKEFCCTWLVNKTLKTFTVWNCCAELVQSVQRLGTSWMVRGPNSDGSEIFSTCADRPLAPHSFVYNGYRVKRPGRGVNHPPSSSAEVKERVELPSTPTLGFGPLLGWTVHLICNCLWQWNGTLIALMSVSVHRKLIVPLLQHR